MKFIPLIWAGLWRKKGRTLLGLLSILAAFTLFGVLQGFSLLIQDSGKQFKADQLMVGSRGGGMVGTLPYADVAQIAQVPGVASVTFRNLFVGSYQKPNQIQVGFGIDAREFFPASTEFTVPPQAVNDLAQDRQGLLADARLIQKYGWKIGDRISLKNLNDPTSGDGAGNWKFNLVGTFTMSNAPGSPIVFFNNDYYDQGRVRNKGTVSMIGVTTTSPAVAPRVSSAIDALFNDSPAPTLTQPVSAFIQTGVKQIGDLDYIIHAVLGVVFLSLLVSNGTVVMRAIGDRTPELAVLKTIGFTNRGIALLLYGETLLLALAGAGAGVFIASLILPVIAKAINTGYNSLPPLVLPEGILIAILFAAVVGYLPVRRAMRLEIVDAIGGN